MIHACAVVSPRAQIGANVEIGPFAVVEEDVTIGTGCRIASGVIIKSGTTLGEGNIIAEHCVLGGLPQHASPPEQPGRLVIGAYNRFREYCTVHRSLYGDQSTSIGDRNFLMVGVHVGHDSQVGSATILTNNVLLAGHVEVEDRAYLSGAAAVHQFCRVGQLAMVGGHARVKKDVPPYMLVADGDSVIVGLNTIGLRRNNFSSEEIEQLKQAYRLIYRRGLPWKDVPAALQEEFPSGPAADYFRFLSSGRRGIAPERRMPPRTTLRLHRQPDEDASVHRKAG